MESLFYVVCVYLVQQSLTVFWREERSKIIETIIFEIPISITMGFAVISTTCIEFLNYNGKETVPGYINMRTGPVFL